MSWHLRLHRPKLSAWQRGILIGIVIALSAQLHISALEEGFRVSLAAVLYPVLLMTWMRESHRPFAGAVTGLCVVLIRILLDVAGGSSLESAWLRELPGGIFYLCYDSLFCFFIPDRRIVSMRGLWATLIFCDFTSNVLNLALLSYLNGTVNTMRSMTLAGIALGRATAACLILWVGRLYCQLLLREEHETRYRRLFLMTANLKTELYFLKKDTEEVEEVMAKAYRLYEQLEQRSVSQELRSLALSIARDVHEIKKDNLRIIRGLENEVEEAYDHEEMTLLDLMHILEQSTRQLLGEQRADIRLECVCTQYIPIREHYRLLSVLKNLVTNAVEAIQMDTGYGCIRVEARRNEEQLKITVSDNGPGISERSKKLLFNVGYSTKFNPENGNIGRGVGLPAVLCIVEELGGSIQVESQKGRGTQFQISLPLQNVTGG